MKGRILAAAGLSLAAAASAHAQASQCGSTVAVTVGTAAPGQMATNAAHDLCVQAVDVFQFVAPQLGLALTGGNTTLGQGGTLGGFPHFAVSVRGNVLAGDLPDVANFPSPRTTQSQPSQELPTKNQVVGLPAADLAVGVFKGLPLGITNVGGVDLLVSAVYVPTIGSSGDDFQITPDGNLKLGYGARVGLLQESLLLPGVSASVFRREIPTTTVDGRPTSGSEFHLTDLSVKSTAWRLVASKSLLVFGVAAGVGRDRYEQGVTVSGRSAAQQVGNVSVGQQSFGPVAMNQDLTRTNYFLDLSMNMPFLKLVGEVGQVSGGTVQTYNTFSGGAADQSRVYGSLGLRIGF